MDNRDWTVNDWSKVSFSDESLIQIRENGRLQFIRRRVGEAFLAECCTTSTKHPVKIMVFGATTPMRKSKLIFVKGTVDVARYQDILKKANIVDFLRRRRGTFALMEDGAPAHRAITTKQWHQQHGVKPFPGWPGNSPDLNPIESL